MMLHAVHGHTELRRDLGRAVAAGSLPGALLLHGPSGVGKQRLALWLGQLLLCAAPTTEPCGKCHSCRLAQQLEHPDLQWFFPLPRPKVSGGPDKLGEALEDARGSELATRREQPLYASAAEEAVGLFLAHVQVIRRVAQARPAMGSRKVIIVGDAEALVPQEASPEAANALLKLLEEPPSDTTVILTAADPDGLLPTIRSRLLPIRVRTLPVALVAEFLVASRGAPQPVAATAARLGRGSIGRALAFLPDGDTPGPLEELRRTGRELLEAALSGGAAPRLAAAMAQAPAGARGGTFTGTLEALADWLRDLAAVATGAEEAVANIDAMAWLREMARLRPHAAAGVPHAVHAVEAAAALTQLNINPQLVLARTLRDVQAALAGRTLA
jgi:DNA polymerase III subunit delta'